MWKWYKMRGYSIREARPLPELAAAELESPNLSGWRCERFALLHDIGAQDLDPLVAGLAAGMRRCGHQLVGFARAIRLGRLALDRQLDAAFKDIARFDSRVGMPRHDSSGFHCRFRKGRHLTRRRTVHLR